LFFIVTLTYVLATEDSDDDDDDDDDDDVDTDRPDMVQDFVARVRNPTLVMLEWTPPRRPGVIKYRVRLSSCNSPWPNNHGLWPFFYCILL